MPAWARLRCRPKSSERGKGSVCKSAVCLHHALHMTGCPWHIAGPRQADSRPSAALVLTMCPLPPLMPPARFLEDIVRRLSVELACTQQQQAPRSPDKACAPLPAASSLTNLLALLPEGAPLPPWLKEPRQVGEQWQWLGTLHCACASMH